MKKRFLIVMAITSAFAFGACQEDPAMDELQVELNQEAEPDETSGPDHDPPGPKKDKDNNSF